MNRKLIYTLILCFLFLFLTGCSKPIEWKEGVRSRSSDCIRTYKEWTVETSYASYAIEIEAVENQQQAEELIQKTEADLEKLREHLPGIDLNNPTIFIVIADLAEGKKVKASYASGSTVITDSDKVLSGEYLAALISSAAKINQPWIAYGIASMIRNDLPEDENLKLFYKNGGDINILGLFGARFYEEIAGEDFLYAKDTASSLVRYIQTQYGTDAIEDLILQKSTLDLSSVKADWLNHIEADVKYTYPFKNMFDSYEFLHSSDSSIQIIAPFASYQIKMQTEETYFLNSVDRLELFLYKNKKAVEELLSILNESPAAKFLNLNELLNYDIDESASPSTSYTDKPTNVTYLHERGIEYAHLHEAAHVYQPFNVPANKEDTDLYGWVIEGFASYMTTQVTNEFSCYITNLSDGTITDLDYLILARAIERNWDGSTYFQHGYSDSASNSAKLERYLKEYYLLHDTIIGLETFDRSFYMDALAYAIAKAVGNDVSDKKINRYPQYESFVGYLVNQYSLEHVIQTVADYAMIKEVFGKSAEELFVEWERYLGL